MDTSTHPPFDENPDPRLAAARSLDARILLARRAERSATRDLALLLAEMAAGALFRALGYASIGEYAEAVLDLPWRSTRDMLRLGRRLPDLPILDAAMASGEIDWTKARELVRVVTPESEPTWVARARQVTSRVLEREVAAACPGDPAPTGDPEPERIPARRRVSFQMEAADEEMLRAAIALLRARSDLDPTELEDGALLASMARLVIAREEAADRPPAEGSAEPDPTGDSAVTGERVRFVIQQCPDCMSASGLDGDVSDTVLAEARCDAEIIDLRPGETQGHAIRTIAPALRRRILHRAKWRCEVPNCRNRLWLDVHHTDPWARSHKHEFTKLMVLCNAHHRAAHDGYLGVELRGDEEHRRVVVSHGDGRESTADPAVLAALR